MSTPSYCRCVSYNCYTGRGKEKGSLHLHCPGPSITPEIVRLQEKLKLAYPDDVCLVGMPTLAILVEDKEAVLHVWSHTYMQSCNLAIPGYNGWVKPAGWTDTHKWSKTSQGRKAFAIVESSKAPINSRLCMGNNVNISMFSMIPGWSKRQRMNWS